MVSLHRVCVRPHREDGLTRRLTLHTPAICFLYNKWISVLCGKVHCIFGTLIVGVTIYIIHTISKLEEYLLG